MSMSYLVTTTLAVSLLIIIVLATRREVATRFGANAAYALWLLPALRLVMPPLPASLSPFGWFAITPTPEIAGGNISPATTWTPTPSLNETAAAPSSPTPAADAWASSPAPDTPLTAANLGDGLAATLNSAGWQVATLTMLLASAVVFYAWTLFRQARFARLVALESSPASETLIAMANDVQAMMGVKRSISVRRSFLPSSPLVMGLFRPTIVVPAWFELDYSKAEQRLAIVHELAHVKRGDLFALHVAHLLLALQWFNPLAHYAMRAFRADQEAACDALVLARGDTSPHAYGATLLKGVKLMRPAPQLQVAGLTLDHGLKERFERMGAPAGRTGLIGKTTAVLAGSLLIFASATTVSADNGELLGGAQVEVEPWKNGTRTVVIDGRETLLLAEDPFEPMHRQLARLDRIHEGLKPPSPPELDIAPVPPVPPVPPVIMPNDLKIDLDLGHLEGKFVLDSLADLGELAALGVLEGLGDSGFEVSTGDDGSFSITGEGVNVKVSGFDAAAFEANMEAFERKMERFEEQMDAYAEKVEAEAERYAEKLEAKVDAVIDSQAFQNATDDGDAVIEDLSEKCDDKLEKEIRASVVETRAPHSRRTYRAICIDPDNPLDDAAYKAFIKEQNQFTKAQREAFLKKRYH